METNKSFYLLVSFLVLVLATSISCSHKIPYYNFIDDQSTKQQDSLTVRQRVILIGDAGSPMDCLPTKGEETNEKCEPVLNLLEKWASKEPKKTFTIFLGDNVYPDGVRGGVDKDCARGKKNTDTWDETEVQRLEAQADVLSASKSSGVFVPGNHDWGGASGPCYSVLENQKKLLAEKARKDWPGIHKLSLQAGCPGPVNIDREGVRIIVLDSQWWLTKGAKPDNCLIGSEDLVRNKMKELLRTVEDREVIVAMHHPLDTHGPHGGFFTWKDHIFPLTNLHKNLYLPLPVVGSIYPLGRKYIKKSDQDLVGRKNKHMREKIHQMFSINPPLIFASGHEHSLQVIQGVNTAQYLLVSGAGSQKKLEAVGHSKETTLFAHENVGFMVVDFLEDENKNRKVLLQVVEPGDKEIVYSKWLRY